MKTPWEKEKLLVTSNFSFSHSVFYLSEELSAIFINFEIVVSKLFQFGRVLNLSFGKGIIYRDENFPPFLQSCWNCGRKASETCSGCNTARYCGSFCQHKDWENHHHVCGKATMSALSQVRDTPPHTVSVSSPIHSPVNPPSPVNSVASVKSPSRSSTPADSSRASENRSADVSRIEVSR